MLRHLVTLCVCANAVSFRKPEASTGKIESALVKKVKKDWAKLEGDIDTVQKEEKAPAKDEKFPWWANATKDNMPNLTHVKTEKAPVTKDEKFPWWANATQGSTANFTQIKKEKV